VRPAEVKAARPVEVEAVPPAEAGAVRLAAGEPFAWRLDLAAAERRVGALTFFEAGEGAGQGRIAVDARSAGDIVLARKDVGVAYHLAVVVDDARQAVTDVVRGADLLDNTPWQIALQRAPGLPTPRYTHLPLVVEPQAGKLSKSRRALALDNQDMGAQLYQSLTILGQTPPLKLKLEPTPVILAWATAHWSVERFRGVREVLLQG